MNLLRGLVIMASVLTGLGMLAALIIVPANVNPSTFFAAMLAWTFVLTPWWMP